jgi:hypothetical protein
VAKVIVIVVVMMMRTVLHLSVECGVVESNSRHHRTLQLIQ